MGIQVLEAAAAADVEFLSGGNVAAAMSQVVRLARRQQITHTTDTRPLARRCTPLVARAVQVIEQEAADEQAGKAPQRRRMALRQVVDVVRALAALDAAEEVFPQQLEVLLAAACARIVASDSPSPQVNELVWALARARHMPGPPVREAIDHWLQVRGLAWVRVRAEARVKMDENPNLSTLILTSPNLTLSLSPSLALG